MRPGIGFGVGTAGDTIVTSVVDTAPVHSTRFGVDSPFSGASGIRYIYRFRGHIAKGDRP